MLKRKKGTKLTETERGPGFRPHPPKDIHKVYLSNHKSLLGMIHGLTTTGAELDARFEYREGHWVYNAPNGVTYQTDGLVIDLDGGVRWGNPI